MGIVGNRSLRAPESFGHELVEITIGDLLDQEIVDAVGDYARVGVEHVVLAPDSGDVPRLRDKAEQIARDVIPSFR